MFLLDSHYKMTYRKVYKPLPIAYFMKRKVYREVKNNDFYAKVYEGVFWPFFGHLVYAQIKDLRNNKTKEKIIGNHDTTPNYPFTTFETKIEKMEITPEGLELKLSGIGAYYTKTIIPKPC